ncbi:hypothetical protein CCYA_CCYA04G1240 [Cyanidiococcus yangmingshanensis]|nr:hypothetical protein CCYA_CCYA04G1240 [Cyanidiococcus yangmingshanensis]
MKVADTHDEVLKVTDGSARRPVLVVDSVVVGEDPAQQGLEAACCSAVQKAIHFAFPKVRDTMTILWDLLTSSSPSDFLLRLPQGAYTVARTCREGRSVVSLAFHECRLLQTLNVLGNNSFENSFSESSAQFVSGRGKRYTFLRERIRASLKAALNARLLHHSLYYGNHANSGEALLLIYIPSVEANDDKLPITRVCTDGSIPPKYLPVFVRCSELRPPSIEHGLAAPGPVDIEFHLGRPRSKAYVKYSSWVWERESFECRKERPQSAELVIVSNENDELVILEGLTSNIFFFYTEGFLATASKDILCGHMRELVLKASVAHGIPVRLDHPPCIAEYKSWSEVFLVSATRLLSPVRSIWVGRSLGKAQELWKSANPPSLFADRLRAWTIEQMHLAAESVLD